MSDSTKTKTCPTGQTLKSGKCVTVKKAVKKSTQKGSSTKVTFGKGGKVTARVGIKRKEGLRYYEGSATKRNPSLAKSAAIARARRKEQFTPSDSVRFAPIKKKKKKK